MNRTQAILFVLLVFSGVAIRLVCRDIPNFAPVAALALFAGFYFRSSCVAAMVPVCVLAISNLQLGGYRSWAVMISVYGCLILPVFFGRVFLKQVDPARVPFRRTVLSALAGSLLFFFVTNYTAWYYWYPPTVEGFIGCYLAAIPFFRFTLAGDLFFTMTFFGGYAVYCHLATRRLEFPRFAPLPELVTC